MACLDHGLVGNALGYATCRFGGKFTRQHRRAYCIANGLALADIDGKVVRHTCDNPRCVNPAHLVIGTQEKNMRDMAKRARGNTVKLTPQEVLGIRASSMTAKELSAINNVTIATIYNILGRRAWKDV